VGYVNIKKLSSILYIAAHIIFISIFLFTLTFVLFDGFDVLINYQNVYYNVLKQPILYMSIICIYSGVASASIQARIINDKKAARFL